MSSCTVLLLLTQQARPLNGVVSVFVSTGASGCRTVMMSPLTCTERFFDLRGVSVVVCVMSPWCFCRGVWPGRVLSPVLPPPGKGLCRVECSELFAVSNMCGHRAGTPWPTLPHELLFKHTFQDSLVTSFEMQLGPTGTVVSHHTQRHNSKVSSCAAEHDQDYTKCLLAQQNIETTKHCCCNWWAGLPAYTNAAANIFYGTCMHVQSLYTLLLKQ
jgi:hypothetical protein